jgi:hypothetical protein
MFTVKKIFVFKDYMFFLLMILYFCFCYLAVNKFEVYSVTQKANPACANPENVVEEHSAFSDSEEDIPHIYDTRTLRQYRGGIGIFDCFDSLIGSFDIDVALLPYEDRKSLEQGIVFANENEMKEFLESLDS